MRKKNFPEEAAHRLSESSISQLRFTFFGQNIASMRMVMRNKESKFLQYLFNKNLQHLL